MRVLHKDLRSAYYYSIHNFLNFLEDLDIASYADHITIYTIKKRLLLTH